MRLICSQLCTFFLFNIAPIFLDVLFVSSFMLANYTIWITLITLVVISIYIIFTIGVTEVRNSIEILIDTFKSGEQSIEEK